MEMRYALDSSVSVPQIIDELDTLWAGLQNADPASATAADTEDLMTEIKAARREDLISVTRHGAGLDAASTAIIVSFAPVFAKIVKDLWDNYFLPKLKQKFGEDIVTST